VRAVQLMLKNLVVFMRQKVQINDAESDRICCEKIIQSRYVTAEAESPCDGRFYKVAASNK
jgi:hypothetical protein